MFQLPAEHRDKALGQRYLGGNNLNLVGQTGKLGQRQRISRGRGQDRHPGLLRHWHPGKLKQLFGVIVL